MSASPILDSPGFTSITERIAQSAHPIPLLREINAEAMAQLHQRFHQGEAVSNLVGARAQFIDELLAAIWCWCGLPVSARLCLVAVGGYGRAELHPHSDIDLLILLGEGDADGYRENLERFVTALWDIKLDIGHSVRSVPECVKAARADITIATNLMESRPLVGDFGLHRAMSEATGPHHVWPSRDFYRAKWDEQIARHRKFGDTEYKLEPNVKTSPGGLRDIQTIAWIAKRHFQTSRLEELVARGFLTAEEFQILTEGRDFLWLVRWALHMLSGREEDRLLFEHQRQLAELFGFIDSEEDLAVEKFMQLYYRWALALSELNELVVQLYDEAILRACDPETQQPLNQRFFARNNYIDTCNDKVFRNQPSAILEIFVLLANNPQLVGPRASAIRLLRESRHLIDDEFRQDPRNQQLFIQLLRSPHKVATQLQRMTRYGILGNYLPEFGRVIGMMQHDLFHIYTVDAHTIQVVKNMRLFAHEDFADKFPIAASIIKRLPKRELLYIAGLYHDIAKGRGGNHSQKGAVDAQQFCRRHGFSEADTDLVAWLVEHHLLMSSTSQRKDISDPAIIQDFADAVGDQLHLDYLYALTVADINATNPKLWTSWRASLLRQLYLETKRALRRSSKAASKQVWVEEGMENAIRLLENEGFDAEEILEIWDQPADDYFLRESPADIAWHTRAMAGHDDPAEPLVLIKDANARQIEGATGVFIYTRSFPELFALTAATFEQLQLSIQDARLYKTAGGCSMNIYMVLEANGEPIGDDPERTRSIQNALRRAITQRTAPGGGAQRRVPRRLQHFDYPTQVAIGTDEVKHCTTVEVITPDRPGVLALIGRVFLDFNLQLQNAKISTMGERVEDVFFITETSGEPVEDAARRRALADALCACLDQRPEPTREATTS